MIKTLAVALAFILGVTYYAEADEQTSSQQPQTEQMQKKLPTEHNGIKPDSENVEKPNFNGENEGSEFKDKKEKPNFEKMKGNPPQSKGKRPNKRPDSQPGGDRTPPEFNSDNDK